MITRTHQPSRPRSNRAVLACLLLILAPVVVHMADEPLTEEDVVRMFVSGRPVDEIVRRIDESDGAFDLSEEMIEELRLAGVPAELIQAMRNRQAEQQAGSEDDAGPLETADPEPAPLLRVNLNAEWEPTEKRPRPVVEIIDRIDPATYQRFRMNGDDPRYTDVAIALLCRTPDHVPDHWRGQSPLGRDFVNTPRHRMLAFVGGAERTEPGKLGKLAAKVAAVVAGTGGAQPEVGLLSLVIPPALEAEIEASVVHDLTLAVALQAEGRYYLMVADDRDGLLVPETGIVLEAEVTSGSDDGPDSIGVRFSPPSGATSAD